MRKTEINKETKSIESKNFKSITKLEKILSDRSMKQNDFQRLIEYTINKNNWDIKVPELYQISKAVLGKQKNPSVKQTLLFAKTLGVRMEDIIDENFPILSK